MTACRYLVSTLFAIGATTLSLSASAGSWSSGGGEILEHAQNPWFLDTPNSAPVKYCVIAAQDFAVPPIELERLVENAIEFWNVEFSNAYYPDNIISIGDRRLNLQIFVNTSRFIKEQCQTSTDLAFQFGTLTNEQTTEFDRLQIDLKRYVALTIRTDYSDALRGKGFIYVSPDRGPNAFRGQNVRGNAWTDRDSQYQALQLVLKHELGHVFGLSHASTNDSIMSARMAEKMVSDRFGDIDNLQAIVLGAVFFPKREPIVHTCKVDSNLAALRAYFDVPADLPCIRVMLDLNRLSITAGPEFNGPGWVAIGTASFADGGQRRHHNLVTLWLPQTQTLFPNLPHFVASLLGPSSSEVQQHASFEFTDGRKKPIFIQASPRFTQVGGVVGDQIIPDLLPKTQFGRSVSGWSDQ